MTDTIATRPAAAILTAVAALFTRRARAPRRGPMPRWIDDEQLREQILRDTGLTLEDLTGQPRYDETKPFFMQQDLR